MDTQLFQTANSQFGKVKFSIIRLIALLAFGFAVYDFNENTFFFSILIVTSASIFLLIGARRITIYKDYFIVDNECVLKTTPLKHKYYYNKLLEVSADIPNDISDMLLKRVDPLSMSYRFVVLPHNETPKTFWITTDVVQLHKAMEMVNQYIAVNSNLSNR